MLPLGGRRWADNAARDEDIGYEPLGINIRQLDAEPKIGPNGLLGHLPVGDVVAHRQQHGIDEEDRDFGVIIGVGGSWGILHSWRTDVQIHECGNATGLIRGRAAGCWGDATGWVREKRTDGWTRRRWGALRG